MRPLAAGRSADVYDLGGGRIPRLNTAWLAEAGRFRLQDPHLYPGEADRIRRMLAKRGRPGESLREGR